MTEDFDVRKDYYAILGVSPSATQEEIKRAYHRLARRYHPDSRPTSTPTTMFHQIHQAYAVLGDPDARGAYDRKRAEQGLSRDDVLTWKFTPSQSRLYTGYEEQVLYLLVEVCPADASRKERLPLNLGLVIDRSTSMKGARLSHLKRAAHQIVDQLTEQDSLSIVTFNDRAEVVLPNQVNVNPIQAKAKIASMQAEGGTEILQGLQTGLSEIVKRHSSRVHSHLILLTDGQTYGDEDDCMAAAKRAGEREINISAMGIGDDWNDALLDKLAVSSGGTSTYIASAEQIQPLLQERIRGINAVFARGLALTIRPAERVHVRALHRTAPDFEPLNANNGRVNLGSLRVDSPMHLVLELAVTGKSAGKHNLLQLELTGDVPSRHYTERLRREFRAVFTDEAPSNGKAPSKLLNALQQITLYRMQNQAWGALDAGNVTEATHKLNLIATRLLDLGKQDLARAARLEAGRISKRGLSTSEGRKKVKYGTRMLALDAPGEIND